MGFMEIACGRRPGLLARRVTESADETFVMENVDAVKEIEAKAFQLYKQADEKANAIGGILDCFGLLTYWGGGRGKEACDLYDEAAKMFKSVKRWREAGEALVKAADICATRRGGMYGCTWESAHNYSDAAGCLRNISVPLAAHCIEKAAKIYAQMGELDIAAMEHHSIAELYEACAHDSEKAMEHYEKAGEYFLLDDRISSANGCFLRTAQLAAHLQQFERAVEIFERIACDNLASDKWVTDCISKAVLCSFCKDIDCVQKAIDMYCDQFPAFAESPDHAFLKDVSKAISERDARALASVKSVHEDYPCDKLTLALLTALEKKLQTFEGGSQELHQQLKLL